MNKEKTIHFMIGMTRSGSTVLSAILNQNPDVYVTPTSPLLGYLLRTQDAYYKIEESIANPNFEQLTNMSRAMFYAAWEHRKEPIIIDKHRGWGKNMPAVTTVLGKKIKAIATVRDLPSVMASWLTLINNNPNTNGIDKTLCHKNLQLTNENRLRELWFSMVKDCMESLMQARKEAGDRLLIVDYDDFIVDPKLTLKKIEDFLELPTHTYVFENIVKEEQDDDLTAWGFADLHKIRHKLEKTSKPAIEILGKELYDTFVEIEKEYEYR